MSQTKPLTQDGLIKTLRKVGVATKDDVKTIVKEQTKNFATKDDVKTIVKEQTKNFATKNDVKTIVKEQTKNFATKDDVKTIVKEQVDTSERRLIRRMGKMERSLRQSIADLAETTPTRTEFETLKHYQAHI